MLGKTTISAMSDQTKENRELEKVETLPPEPIDQEALGRKIQSLTPEDLNSVTTSVSFREATAKLLAGSITYAEWEWFASRALARRLDLPLVEKAVEQEAFASAFEVFGAALEGVIAGGSGNLDEVTKDDRFRAAVLDLLQGEITVPEFIGSAEKTLEERVDIPYVPQFGEEIVFDRGLELLASSLHGLLTEGTRNGQASDVG